MNRAALLMIVAAGLGSAAHAPAPAPLQPNTANAIVKRAEAAGLMVNCPDWRQETNGTWSSNARGTIFYPNHIGNMGDDRGFGHATMSYNGIDVGDYIAAKCTPRGGPSIKL